MTKLIFCLKQNIIDGFFVYLVILMMLHHHQTTSHNHNEIASHVKVLGKFLSCSISIA